MFASCGGGWVGLGVGVEFKMGGCIYRFGQFWGERGGRIRYARKLNNNPPPRTRGVERASAATIKTLRVASRHLFSEMERLASAYESLIDGEGGGRLKQPKRRHHGICFMRRKQGGVAKQRGGRWDTYVFCTNFVVHRSRKLPCSKVMA